MILDSSLQHASEYFIMTRDHNSVVQAKWFAERDRCMGRIPKEDPRLKDQQTHLTPIILGFGVDRSFSCPSISRLLTERLELSPLASFVVIFYLW
ncbi:hypothetical protein ACLOJK_016421 [Asimina triloba]